MCNHEEFLSKVEVHRLTEQDGKTIIGYAADITVKCSKCGMPFEFVGVGNGISDAAPRVSVDGFELRAPIKPASCELVFKDSHRFN